jgi:ribonucleoside-diphosphate reductase alpha chain
LKNYYSLLWDAPNNTGYLNICAVIQKFFDQSISANTAYNSEKFPDNKVPMSIIVGDMLYAYSIGLKNLYYHNTNDAKKDEGEELLKEMDKTEIKTEDDDCDACKV